VVVEFCHAPHRPSKRDVQSTSQPGSRAQEALQQSASAADLSSAGASAATRESSASLWGCTWEAQPSPQSSNDSEGTGRRGCESEGEGSGDRMVCLRSGQDSLDVREQPAWERVAAGVDDALAVLLRGEGVFKTEQTVRFLAILACFVHINVGAWLWGAPRW